MGRAFDPNLASMGNRIARKRKELGMKACDLALQAGITAQALSAIENGSRATSVDILMRICEALKCSMADIQPEELDHYEAIPKDFFKIARILQTKPVRDQKMMLKMFEAQLSTI